MSPKSRLVRILRDAVRRLTGGAKKRRLEQLRKDNPSCHIDTSQLTNSVLGEHVALHAGSMLRNVTIADYSYVSFHSEIDRASIGKFCSIGPHVTIGLARHPVSRFVSTYPAFFSNDNIGCLSAFRKDKIFDDSVPVTTIANDVWIGSHAMIPGGITIHSGAVIAAGAVVVKDVPPYAIVGGNPARVIRFRFTEQQIAVLLGSAWWDWPIDKIVENTDRFADVDSFSAFLQLG